MLTDEQIQAMVMARYPQTDKERSCRQEAERLKNLRDHYREKLRCDAVGAPTLN